MDPCGTTKEISTKSESLFSIFARNIISERYDLNHFLVPSENFSRASSPPYEQPLKQIGKREETVVTNLDKGRAVIIMDTTKLADRQLNCTTNYFLLFLTKIINWFDEQKLLPENIKDELTTINIRKPKRHISPKTHKRNDPSHH